MLQKNCVKKVCLLRQSNWQWREANQSIDEQILRRHSDTNVGGDLFFGMLIVDAKLLHENKT